MKKLFFLFLLIVLSLKISAQKKSNKYLGDDHGNTLHYMVTKPWSKCNILLLVDGGTKRIEPFIPLNDELGNMVYLEGTKQIELETRIHRDSLKFYRYTVIENDSNFLVKDAIPTKIKFIWNARSDHPGYLTIDLGVYNNAGKKITIQLYRIEERGKINTVVIYNKKIAPAQILYASIYSGRNKRYAGKPFKLGGIIVNNDSTKFMMVAIKSTDLNSAFDVTLSNIDDPALKEIQGNWKYIGPGTVGFFINAEYFKKPGTYEVAIAPKLGYDFPKSMNGYKIENVTKFRFVVAKPDEETFRIKEVIIIGLIAIAIFSIVLFISITYIKRKGRKKLALAQQHKEIAKLQINSIRSQLNPHFMFNALAGIQNLMNQNKIDEVNNYLGKFARLTRNVLDQNELISLAEERELLADYLQMEQLRFGFSYEIEVGPNIDLNIEIPSMLLQPFVENAVKHGIASNANQGEIKILFEVSDKDLILSVQDNGIGFDVGQTYQGLGLQLSKNRIYLLNKIYATTPFILELNSNENGTTIRITLTQWL